MRREEVLQLLGLPDFHEVRKVVCVQPHPDDNEVGMGGAIAALRERGCEVVYITVTDGRSGSPDGTLVGEALVETRLGELHAAGEILSVNKQITLGYPDAGPYQEDNVYLDLLEHFRHERPDVVFTVDPWMQYEAHPDHIKTGHAVARAVMFSGNPTICPEHQPFQVQQIGFYHTSYPNTFVDVTAQWDKKMASVFAHQSQFFGPAGELVRMFLTGQASELARSQNMPQGHLVEAFKMLAAQQLHSMPATVFN